MSPKTQSFTFPAQSGVYFDDYVTRNRWLMGLQVAAIHMGVPLSTSVLKTQDGFTVEIIFPQKPMPEGNILPFTPFSLN